MKTVTYLLFVLMIPATMSGQNNPSTTELPGVNEAMRYVHAMGRPYYPERALEILQQGADVNIPSYMNALGVYYSGIPGIEPDWEKAVTWFRKAALTGDAKALYNLGMIYKYGRGVKQDMEKSFYYARLSAGKGDPNGCYFAGYMLYKGLGCKQDYKEAARYLQQSVDQDHYPAMYLLGLCYRNGFGVERDTAAGKFYLEVAASRGYSFAQDELVHVTPEIEANLTLLKSAEVIGENFPKSFEPVAHNLTGKSVEGNYSGTLITYDWSGEHVLNRALLQLRLESVNDTIKGQWVQNDSTVVVFTAKLTDEGLIFNDAVVPRKDHYNEYPLMYQFQKATLSVSETGENLFLAGNLQMFSQATMEPERPLYLSLSKNIDYNNLSDQSQTKNTITDLIAFPNPFKDNLAVHFFLSEESSVRLELLNLNGGSVYKASAGKLQTGKNSLNVNIELPSGSYILMLKTRHYTASTMVVKN